MFTAAPQGSLPDKETSQNTAISRTDAISDDFQNENQLSRQGHLPDSSFSKNPKSPRGSQMLRNGDKMKPNWMSWTASQAPDKSPSWTGQLQDRLASQAGDKSASWKRKLSDKSPFQAPDRSASLIGLPPEQMGLPVVYPDRPASWTSEPRTCQPPGQVSLTNGSASWTGFIWSLDKSTSRTGWPFQQVGLQGKTPDRTPMTNRQLTAQRQGLDMN